MASDRVGAKTLCWSITHAITIHTEAGEVEALPGDLLVLTLNAQRESGASSANELAVYYEHPASAARATATATATATVSVAVNAKGASQS